MNFLLLLIAAVVEFTVVSLEGLRARAWSNDWAAWVNRSCGRYGWWDGPGGALLTIAVPVLLVAFAFSVLHGISAFLGHAASLLVLLLMLGPADLNALLDRYKGRLLQAGDVDEAEFREDLLTFAEDVDFGEPTGDSSYDAHRGELASIALAADKAWFQPLFWFFVLGPVGAVLYRLCANLRASPLVSDGVCASVATVRELLEWLPSRLTVLAMGIAGTLVPVLDRARASGIMRWSASEGLVAHAALAAIDQGRISEVIGTEPRLYRLNTMHALVKRTLNAWLVTLAVMALLFAG